MATGRKNRNSDRHVKATDDTTEPPQSYEEGTLADKFDTDILLQHYEVKAAKVARDNLAELINQSRYQKQRTIIKQHNKVAAALVPIEDLAILHVLAPRAKPTDPYLLEEISGTIDEFFQQSKTGDQDVETKKTERIQVAPRSRAPSG